MATVSSNDFLSMDATSNPVGTPSVRGSELINTIQQRIGAVPEEFYAEGIEAEYMPASGGGLQKGRLRLVLEFVPTPTPPHPTGGAAAAR